MNTGLVSDNVPVLDAGNRDSGSHGWSLMLADPLEKTRNKRKTRTPPSTIPPFIFCPSKVERRARTEFRVPLGFILVGAIVSIAGSGGFEALPVEDGQPF